MSPTHKTDCPSCGKSLKVKPEQVGRNVRCPACEQRFELQSFRSSSETSIAGITVEGLPPESIARSTTDAGAVEKLGRYEIQGVLGEGGFGRVYRAYDPQLDRQIALKIPLFGAGDSVRTQRFLTEAKAAGKLQHRAIVPTYDSGQIDGRLYIASAYIEGKPLSDVIRRGNIGMQRAAEWVRDLAEALAYAHAAGVVHRDIKPHNVMIDAANRPYLMDFGLAKRSNEDSSVTTDGSLLGTPAYMSPEQARGELSKVGPASDQYSLGVVLYELLTGRKPFEGSPHVVIGLVASQAAPAPRSIRRQISADLEAICQRAMNRDPAARYADCADFAKDLTRWLQGESTLARPLKLSEKVWREVKQRLQAVLAISMILFLGVLVAVQWISRSEHPLPDAKDEDPLKSLAVASPARQQPPADSLAVARDDTKGDSSEVTKPDPTIDSEISEEKVVIADSEEKETSSATMDFVEDQSLDRQVATWLLKNGGQVMIVDLSGLHTLTSPDGLPAGQFHVHEIQLSGVTKEIPLLLWEKMGQLPDLKNCFDFSYRRVITPQGIAQVSQSRSLIGLTLSGNDLSAESLSQIVTMPQLSNLDVASWALSDEDLKLLSSVKNLTRLTVPNTATDVGLQYVSQAAPMLNFIGIAYAPHVTSKGLRNFSSLRSLHMRSQHMDAEFGRILKRLPNLRSILVISPRPFNVDFSYINDRSMDVVEWTAYDERGRDRLAASQLTSFLRLKRAKELRIVCSLIDDTHVPQFVNCAPGQKIILRGTELTLDGVLKIRKQLPKCTIETDVPGSADPESP